MIITQTPLRISIGGGGTDLPSYYKKFGGFFISAAINKYIYVALHKTFRQEIVLHYSIHEVVNSVDEIKHSLVREAFKMKEIGDSIEMVSMADIPSGTGLGSSGSFTVGLLNAIYAFKKESIPTHLLAEEACTVEIERLKEPVGKQDQYIAAYGGITCFEIKPSGEVTAHPIKITLTALHELEENLVLFFTGFSRSAPSILSDQDKKTKENESKMIENLHEIKRIGIHIKSALESDNLRKFGELMNEHWELKRRRSEGITNSTVDDIYYFALKNGAVGGKLIGAGGGGFLLFYSEDKKRLISAMNKKGFKEVKFGFDFEGSKLIIQN